MTDPTISGEGAWPAQIGTVENAMLARIKAAEAADFLGYSYGSKESWPRNFDAFMSSETVRFPAAWAAFGGCHSFEQITRGRWKALCTFGLVVAAQNARNEKFRRHGGSEGEVGSYQLAQDALRLLLGQDLGLDIDGFKPVSIQQIDTDALDKVKQCSLYAVTFETGLYFDALEMPGDFTALSKITASWDPAPFGHVDPDGQLPPEQTPPAGGDAVNLA